jgi:hypothetical protein
MLADAADLPLFCWELETMVAMAPPIALAHKCYAPVFAPTSESMQCDEAVHAMAAPEMAPALALRSDPVDQASSWPASPPVMLRPALQLSSAGLPSRVSVPALFSNTEAQPSLAPEACISEGDAANPAAGPHSHEPVHPTFWSSARIKNWRLRITFAKPA